MLDKKVYSVYSTLNETDLYIWKYIVENKKKCLTLSITELAKECNTSHTSILRFTKKIGLEGYSELRYLIKFELENELSFDRLIFDRISAEYTNVLHHMKNLDLNIPLGWIDEAERIFIFASGRAQQSAAHELRREFTYSKKIIHVLEDNVVIDTVLETVKPTDLFIIMSFSGDNETSTNLLKFLNRVKVKTIGICYNKESYLAQNADYCITFESSEFNLGSDNPHYASSIPLFLISNMLFLKYIEFKTNKLLDI